MEVVWQNAALEDLLTLSRANSRQATRVFDAVVRYARTGGGDVKALKGRTGEYRIRVGDWRVLFRMDGDRAVVTRVVLRRDAYD
ncbi:MAG: hypothetical protein C0506_04610 [Anaerolinea sp.]|nr:hypothetical protein [Anaerolinea sp.]